MMKEENSKFDGNGRPWQKWLSVMNGKGGFLVGPWWWFRGVEHLIWDFGGVAAAGCWR